MQALTERPWSCLFEECFDMKDWKILKTNLFAVRNQMVQEYKKIKAQHWRAATEVT